MGPMRKLCFLGIPEHEKTRSSEFLKELLRQAFMLSVGEGALSEALIDENDIFLFFQRPPSEELAGRLNGKRIVYVPMYDEARNYSRKTIASWAPYKIISFCHSMHEDLCGWGFESAYAQYFPRPLLTAPLPVEIQKAFYWRRENAYINEAIPYSIVDTLFRGTGVKLHCHSEGAVECVPSDLVVSRSTWTPDKASMTMKMRTCSLYLAPRESEGIGMSFLDAMANGLAVIGANNPTMNEYLVDGENGYLFDILAPRKVDFGALRSVRERSLETCFEGNERWEREKWSLIDFIEAPSPAAARVLVPRGFRYRSLKQKNIRFAIKRFAKKLAGK